MNSPNLFCGDLVRLGALTEKDLPALVKWYQDPLFLRHFDSRRAFPKTECS